MNKISMLENGAIVSIETNEQFALAIVQEATAYIITNEEGTIISCKGLQKLIEAEIKKN